MKLGLIGELNSRAVEIRNGIEKSRGKTQLSGLLSIAGQRFGLPFVTFHGAKQETWNAAKVAIDLSFANIRFNHIDRGGPGIPNQRGGFFAKGFREFRNA